MQTTNMTNIVKFLEDVKEPCWEKYTNITTVNRFFLRVVQSSLSSWNQEWESIELCSSPECWKPLISCWDPAVYLISRQFYLSRCSGNALADFCSPGTSQNVVDVPGVQGMGRGGWMCFRRKIAYNHITKQYQICGFLKMFFCTLGVVFLFKQFIS